MTNDPLTERERYQRRADAAYGAAFAALALEVWRGMSPTCTADQLGISTVAVVRMHDIAVKVASLVPVPDFPASPPPPPPAPTPLPGPGKPRP